MTEWREAFCPVCGRTMGMRTVYRNPDKPYMGVAGQENRWEDTRNFTGDKPFGVVKSSEGKGSLKFERYYDLDEDQEGYFPLIKDRILNVIAEWHDKGWLTREDVEEKLS